MIYELDDAQIESALAADEARGVAVRVLLSADIGAQRPARRQR